MKNAIIISGLAGLILIGALYAKRDVFTHPNGTERPKIPVEPLLDHQKIQDGDLIFQTSLSGQSKAIQLATNSKYAHCGIIYRDNGRFYVFEAVQPVKTTPLDQWIARGENAHYVVKRLINADQILTTETLQKMKVEGKKFEGKNYDLTFEWSDDKIYCSELIWKVYQRAAGIEIGKLEKLRDFDLTHETVRKTLKERYGDNIPMDELVISPASIFESEHLMTVKERVSNN